MAQSASVSGTIKDPDQSVVEQCGGDAEQCCDGAVGAACDGLRRDGIALLRGAGTYRLEAQKDGFAPAVVASIVVADGQSVTQDVVFAGGCGECVGDGECGVVGNGGGGVLRERC